MTRSDREVDGASVARRGVVELVDQIDRILKDTKTLICRSSNQRGSRSR